LLATVSFDGFTLQGLVSARDKGVPTAYYGALFNDPRTQNFDRHQYVDLSYQHSFGQKWDLTARTSYDQADLRAPVAYSTGLPDGSTTVNTYSFQGDWWDSEFKLRRTLFQKHKVTFGTEIIDNLKQDQLDHTAIGNISTAVPGSSVIWALYIQDEFAITSKLILSAGARYDHYSNFGGTTNPRLGLIYHLSHPTTFKLLYGTSFRAPEPFETTPDFASFDNNLELKPERIRTVEGIVEQQLGEHLTLEGSVFRNWIDNLISIETNSADGQSIYENSQRVDATGLEIEMDGRWVNGSQFRASYSYTDTHQLMTPQPLANSPRQLGKLEGSVPLVRQKLFASFDAQYTSPAQTLAANTVSGFAVFNATLLAHVFEKRLDVSAGVYNFLNRKYFDPGRPEDVEDAIQQDGINFRIKLTARF
jgi:outer membrane receptor for ferrienterochelin and colicins